jgi:hypothetical protein
VIAGGAEVGFELALAIDVGGQRLLDGRYPVTFASTHRRPAEPPEFACCFDPCGRETR